VRGNGAIAGPLAAVAVAALLLACAEKLVPAPTIVTPHYPDFVFPAIPPGMGNSQADARHQRGWRFLQAGDLRNADREFSAALKQAPALYPADAGLGYVGLAERDYRAALNRFDRALKRAADYLPALVGRGDALLGLSRPDEALATFQAALAKDPSLSEVRRRVELLALRDVGRQLATARRATDAGRYDEARNAYVRAIADSPDSAFLYRELGIVERQQGNTGQALEHLRRAVALDPADARSLVQIGEILEARGDIEAALAALTQAAAIEPSDALTQQIERLGSRAELARLPAEYRAIADEPQITRGELAALIGVRLDVLLRTAPRRDAVLITDARGHWAAPWIMAVARAGVMEPYANHAFHPRETVRRVDLAVAVGRLLNLIAARRPQLAKGWIGARPPIADMGPGYLNYPAVGTAVASKVMPLVDGAFRPSRPVSGAEAVEVIGRVEVLAR
jgi:tetratricopeptide (TPR) repeat protein